MALGRRGERQTDPMVARAELPRSPGHAFWKSRIAEKQVPGVLRGPADSVDIPPWDQAEPDGDGVARRAVYDNRVRPRSSVAREGFKRRIELGYVDVLP